ncbi:hypothetical protein [Haladaptatus halobius]|uniref:hypothetical protein n=1 Tax=Haladaptatus halobius TaxID=2884875 RepID=UPI001D0B37A3|nr:hypothetical protein [Haladaptatus halobius]
MNPVVSEALASRVERAEIETLRSRLEAVRGRVGNPMGVEIRKFGDATAFVARNAPGPSFNTVKGVGAAEGERIPAIASFYRRQETPCRVEVAPTRASSDLFAALADRGFV